MSNLNAKLPESYLSNILQQLNCPLFGNGEEWWLQDLFFQSGTHRFQLFDWIICKFGFDKIVECQSPEEKDAKDYLRIFTAMGVCGKSDIKLITGDVTKAKQLKFWTLILDMLLINTQLDSIVPETENEIIKLPLQNDDNDEKYEIKHSSPIKNQAVVDNNSCSNENLPSESVIKIGLNDEDNVFIASKPKKYLNIEYEKSITIMNKLATNVHVNDLFIEKVSIFPPDVEKDINHILSANKDEVNRLPNVKDSIVATESSNKLHLSLIPAANSSFCEDSAADYETIKSNESKKNEAISDFHVAEKQFIEAYNELKPVLQPSDRISNNFGSEFEKIYPQMDLCARVMSYFETSKSISNLLDEESSSLQDFKPSDSNLSASKLEEYITLLQESFHKVSKDVILA